MELKKRILVSPQAVFLRMHSIEVAYPNCGFT